ncbi:aromatic ring-hydroxylating oxygenase subunit alpha [Mycolicibacterium fallax]|jgi:nitrite reductase/ring-hydroxylating ferredoxin subunit|uniref:(2Fe-2S)-binding protein n=1 Tax=Mycolicibacterium fallax TaxID=1793 RepID=A0A1X1RI70_MYCFA|nr:aromatic ring-hydroxylating dioxygenase subunit alpha [Mycolicibacterium fallax]ORV06696.1 (2Fe-2S)-binding protein [Mycolicibacterium fallax]BBY96644.1 (2Fe-2S)-binding protein [Mycolicibacterium fallax]
MTTTQPGYWFDNALALDDIESGRYRMDISTGRYVDADVVRAEHDNIWMKVWQAAGRESELPEVGDWKEYQLLDQSFLLIRGRDHRVRGFVNACRHRGNVLCKGSGNAKRGILCQYHLWSYDLEGKLKGALRERENVLTQLDKESLGLLEVSVDCFAGFIFLNPDPNAAPLREFLGAEVVDLLEPYRLDQMVTVLDVREALNCNWKVVMDAFSEGYHISGIHPQLLQVVMIDPSTTRYRFFDKHSVSCAPFEVAGKKYGLEEQIEGIMGLPETFPSVTAVLPRFAELVGEYRDEAGVLNLPEGVTPRTLLQRATRETLTGMGFDVGGLTDAQMSDNNGWVLFPNFFMTVRAGEATVILAQPHESGDPNRCYWHILSVMWLPEEHREAFAAAHLEVTEAGSFPYFLALQQDYEQMPRQQRGLRNTRLEHMSLVKEEVVIAHFHSVVDRYLAGAAQ